MAKKKIGRPKKTIQIGDLRFSKRNYGNRPIKHKQDLLPTAKGNDINEYLMQNFRTVSEETRLKHMLVRFCFWVLYFKHNELFDVAEFIQIKRMYSKSNLAKLRGHVRQLRAKDDSIKFYEFMIEKKILETICRFGPYSRNKYRAHVFEIENMLIVNLVRTPKDFEIYKTNILKLIKEHMAILSRPEKNYVDLCRSLFFSSEQMKNLRKLKGEISEVDRYLIPIKYYFSEQLLLEIDIGRLRKSIAKRT